MKWWVAALIVVANFLPVVDAWIYKSHGQLLATALGAASALICAAVARDRERSVIFRTVFCVLLVLMWWFLFIFLSGVPLGGRFMIG